MTATKHWRWSRSYKPRAFRPVPFTLPAFVLPAHPWVIEVGGHSFKTLSGAEEYAKRTGQPIYCRLARKEPNP